MRITVVISSIFLHLLCSQSVVAVVAAPAASELVLDLAQVDSNITVDQGEEDGVKYKSFIPKGSRFFIKVTEEENEIWQAPKEVKCITVDLYHKGEVVLLRLQLRQGADRENLHFSKASGEWKGISENEFDDKLEEISQEENGQEQDDGNEEDEEEEEDGIDELILDGLAQLPEVPVDLTAESSQTPDSSTKHAESANDYEQNSHVKGEHLDHPIEDDEDEELSLEERLANLLNTKPAKDENVESKVGAVKSENSTLENLHAPLEPGKEVLHQTNRDQKSDMEPRAKPRASNEENVVLDISDRNPPKVTRTDTQTGDINSTMFFPEENTSIFRLVDSGALIWEEHGSVCIEVYLFSRQGFFPIMNVYTKSGENHACTSLEKVGTEWKRIDKDTFAKKYRALKTNNNTPESPKHGSMGDSIQVPTTHVEAALPSLHSPSIDPNENFVRTPAEAPVEEPYHEPLEAVKANHKLAKTELEPGSEEMMLVKPKEVKREKQKVKQTSETLDLVEQNSAAAQIYETVEDGIIHRSYFPKDKPFTKILDSSKSVWSSKDGKVATLAYTYSKTGHTTILSVCVGGQYKCYRKTGAGWKSITEQEFNARYKDMKEKDLESIGEYSEEQIVETPKESVVKKEAPKEVEPPSPVTVDLSGVNDSKILLNQTTVDATVNTSYVPKGDHYITRVQDGLDEIWVADGEEICTLLYRKDEGGLSKLSLQVKNDKGYDMKLFEKRANKWEGVDIAPKVIIPSILNYKADITDMETADSEDDSSLENDTQTSSTVNTSEQAATIPRNALLQSVKETTGTQEQKSVPVKKVTIPKPTVPVRMDISEIDDQTTDVTKDLVNGIHYKSFIPKGSFYYDRVVDDSVTLWIGTEEEKCTLVNYKIRGNLKLLTLQVKNGNETIFYHFENRDGIWRRLSSSQFNLMLNALTTEADRDYKLDLANVNKNKVLVDKMMNHDVFHFTYYPNGCTNIASIVEGRDSVWAANQNEVLKCCHGCSKGGSSLIHLHIEKFGKEIHRYFERTGNSWKEIDENGFRVKQINLHLRNGVANLRNNVPSSPTIFDIQNPDSLICKTFECSFGGVETFLCVPFWGLKMIKSGPTIIWTSKEAKCILLRVHHKSNIMEMVHLTIECDYQISEESFKRKDGNNWSKVSNYYKEVKKMSIPIDLITGFVLDLRDAEHTEECDVFTANMFGMDTFIFVPKPGFYTTRVTYGNIQLYESDQSKRERVNVAYIHHYSSSILIITIVIENKDNLTEYYFLKEGGVIYNLGRNRYLERLQKMRNRRLLYNYQTFDLTSPDSSCEVIDTFVDCIPAKLIIPAFNTFVNRIVYEGKIIWEASRGGEMCTSAVVYLKGTNPALLNVTSVSPDGLEDAYYKEENHVWSKCTSQIGEEFRRLRTLGGYMENVDLDISIYEGTPRCQVIDMEIHQHPMVLFFPKDNFLVKNIKYAKHHLWRGDAKEDEEERAIIVRLHLKNGTPSFLYVLSRDKLNIFRNYHYERINGEWEDILKDEFNKKVVN